MKRNYHSRKEKMQILEEAKLEKPSDVAAKYGFHAQTIYAWRRQFKKREEASKNDNAIKSNKLQEIEAENAKLKKICIALTFENVSLKETLDKKLFKQSSVSI